MKTFLSYEVLFFPPITESKYIQQHWEGYVKSLEVSASGNPKLRSPL